MSKSADGREERERQLDAIIAEYYRLPEADGPPDQSAFILRYPNYASELKEFFSDVRLLHIEDNQASESSKAVDGNLTGELDAKALVGSTIDATNLLRGKENELIGSYRLLHLLGEGGMGSVYMAEQTRPVKRRVAVKIIKQGLSNTQYIARFEAERQAVAMMDHPNIAKVLDAGCTETGAPFFAMELVKGVPITEYCDHNKLSLKERLELFIQACRAIQHAHQKGIVHRDIKPSNILVALHDGKPVTKVIDFGLAKTLLDSNRLTDKTIFTQFGQVVGTLEYMSPEQAGLNAMDVDTRTDVYSLGVILYELLIGSTPIGRERLKTAALDLILRMIREEEALRPSTRLSSSGDAITRISQQRRTDPKRLSLILKGDLDWIAMKALDKDRTRRYDGPAALADDVQRFLNDEAIDARPPSFGYRIQKTYRKNRRTFAAIAAIAALLIAGIFGTGSMWWLSARLAESNAVLAEENDRTATEATGLAQKANAALKVAEVERDKAAVAKGEALLAMQIAESRAARSNYFLAIARWDANRVLEANELLDRIPTEHRHFEWRLAKRQFCGSESTLYGHTASVNCVAWSRDGSLIVSGSGDEADRPGTIKIWDVVTGQELRTLSGHKCWVTSVALSGDASRVASGGWDQTKVWDTSTGEELLTIEEGGVTSICFSPDDSRIATASLNGRIIIWNASTGDELIRLNEHTAYVFCVCFSPDGSLVVSGSRDKTVRISDTTTGELLQTLKGHTSDVNSVCFSPDGLLVASGSGDQFEQSGTVKLWNSSTGKEEATLVGHSNRVNSVAFSPDGKLLASGSGNPLVESADYTIKIWEISTGEALETLKGHSGRVLGLNFNADGSRLASGSWDRTIKLWDVSTGGKFRSLAGHRDSVTSISFNSSGSQIVSSSKDSSIKVWNATTSKLLCEFNGYDSDEIRVGFSSDDMQVLSTSGEAWDILTGKKTELNWFIESPTRSITSPDGSRVASWELGGGQGPPGRYEKDNTIRLLDSATNEKLITLVGHSNSVISVCFSHDGSRILSGSKDNSIRLWDAETGEELRTLRGNTRSITCACFSPDGTKFASANFSREGSLELWDAQIEQEMTVLRGHTGAVRFLSLSTDGNILFSASGSEKTAWNLKTGERLQDILVESDLPFHEFVSNPSAMNNNWFVISSGNDILLVDLNYKKRGKSK